MDTTYHCVSKNIASTDAEHAKISRLNKTVSSKYFLCCTTWTPALRACAQCPFELARSDQEGGVLLLQGTSGHQRKETVVSGETVES